MKQFAADDWVWGEAGRVQRAPVGSPREVIELYERDYIDDVGWRARRPRARAVHDAVADDRRAGHPRGPASPLRGAARGRRRQHHARSSRQGTSADRRRSRGGREEGHSDRLVGKLFEKLGGSSADQGRQADASPGALVTAHFQPLHRVLAGEPGNTPIDRILVRIGQIQQQLRSLGPGQRGVNPRRRRCPIRRCATLLQSLQQETEPLPPVVQALVAQIGRKAKAASSPARARELERRYRQEVLQRLQPPPRRSISVHRRQRQRELPIGDFARLFGYGGVFDRFFTENLEPSSTRSQSPWAWRAGAARRVAGDARAVRSGAAIRELFFRRGAGSARGATSTSRSRSRSTPSIAFVLESTASGSNTRAPRHAAVRNGRDPTPGLAP